MTKRRQRIILSCDNCHLRKIKCDRKLPCDSCKSRGIASLCRFSALEKELAKQGKSPQVLLGSSDSSRENVQLKNRIKELEALIGVASLSNSTVLLKITPDVESYSPSAASTDDAEDTTDFFFHTMKDGSCIRLLDLFATTFPISFISLLRKDNAYIAFWHFNRLKNQKEHFARHLMEGIGHSLDDHKDLAKHYCEKSKIYFGDYFIAEPEVTKEKLVAPTEEVKNAINGYLNKSTALYFFTGFVPPNSNLYTLCTYLLPPRFIIMQYLETWFDNLEPYFPVFERTNFTEMIAKLVQERNDGDLRVKLNLEKPVDLANLASLLFLLRFTFDFVIRSATSTNQYKELEKYPIPIECCMVAKECLKEYNLPLLQLFDALQAFIMAKVYKTHSLDEGDGVRETDMYIRSLINSGSVCGLNRDPDIFSHEELTWVTKNHRRKLWFFLLSIEFFELTVYGRRLFDMDYSNVKLEEINTPNDDYMYHIMKKILPIREVIGNLMRLLMNINIPVNMRTFISLTEELEFLVDQNFDDLATAFQKLVDHPDDPKVVLDLSYLLALKLLILKMNFSLYLIYERKKDGDMLFKYYKKLFMFLFIELFSVMFLDVYPRIDATAIPAVILDPSIVRTHFIFLMFCATANIHLNHTLLFYTGTQDMPEHLHELSDGIQKVWLQIARFLGSRAKRVFTAWRATKTVLYTIKEIRKNRTFEENCQGQSINWIFSPNQLHELCRILQRVITEFRPPPVSLDNLWLNVIPYDNSKSLLANLEVQRVHVNQIDALWHNRLATIQDDIPDSFKKEEEPTNDSITNLLNPDVDTGMDMFDAFGNVFRTDDFFLNDGFFRI